MIKGNQSDAGSIDLELLTFKRVDKFSWFTLFLKFEEYSLSLQPDVQLRSGFDQNVAFK